MNGKHSLQHCMLEPYKARYTEFLNLWEKKAFSRDFNVRTVVPSQQASVVPMSIMTGEVLDSVSRPIWAMQQVAELLKHAPDIGRVWFSDFYHPGLDSLAYSRANFRAYSFLWAQTFDQYDFTRKFVNWMRPWEVMAFDIYERVFVACDLLKDLIVTALPHVADKVDVVGLPFSHQHVQLQLGNTNVPQTREYDCVYSSRWDTEKNPGFFLDLVEKNPDLSFAVCTGHPELKGNATTEIRRAKRLHAEGLLHLFVDCSKTDYYRVLASSSVQFNCALQDWVSFTLLEALSFGCRPLYPSFRAFPETLLHESAYLYQPENISVASMKLRQLVDVAPKDFDDFRMTILEYHSGTLSRISNTLASL